MAVFAAAVLPWIVAPEGAENEHENNESYYRETAPHVPPPVYVTEKSLFVRSSGDWVESGVAECDGYVAMVLDLLFRVFSHSLQFLIKLLEQTVSAELPLECRLNADVTVLGSI